MENDSNILAALRLQDVTVSVPPPLCSIYHLKSENDFRGALQTQYP